MLKITSKNLLVASIYAPSRRNAKWIELQRRFIKKTTGEHDFGIFLAKGTNASELPDEFIIGEIEPNSNSNRLREGREASQDHARNLARLIDYFRSVDYDYFLILDSDCFPIEINWQDTLSKVMGRKKASAAIRCENMTLSPHPCAFFMNSEALNENWLDFNPHSMPNLLSARMSDVGGKIPIAKTFPLLRTNRINLHPLIGAIYGNLFYHHGGGSRPSGAIVSRSQGYYKNLGVQPAKSEREIYDELIKDPFAFIGKLRGKEYLPRPTLY